MARLGRIVMLCLVTAAAVVSYKAASAVDKLSLQGTIIDNISAGEHASDIAVFVKTYTKATAIKNAVGGYSIYASDGKIYKFDAQGCARIEEFLKKNPDSKLQVKVEAERYTEDLTLISIVNQ